MTVLFVMALTDYDGQPSTSVWDFCCSEFLSDVKSSILTFAFAYRVILPSFTSGYPNAPNQCSVAYYHSLKQILNSRHHALSRHVLFGRWTHHVYALLIPCVNAIIFAYIQLACKDHEPIFSSRYWSCNVSASARLITEYLDCTFQKVCGHPHQMSVIPWYIL